MNPSSGPGFTSSSYLFALPGLLMLDARFLLWSCLLLMLLAPRAVAHPEYLQRSMAVSARQVAVLRALRADPAAVADLVLNVRHPLWASTFPGPDETEPDPGGLLGDFGAWSAPRECRWMDHEDGAWWVGAGHLLLDRSLACEEEWLRNVTSPATDGQVPMSSWQQTPLVCAFAGHVGELDVPPPELCEWAHDSPPANAASPSQRQCLASRLHLAWLSLQALWFHVGANPFLMDYSTGMLAALLQMRSPLVEEVRVCCFGDGCA